MNISLVNSIIITILLLTDSVSIASQEIIIQVLEKGTGQEIKRAELKADKKIWYSNKEGIIKIPTLPIKTTLRIYRKGYKTLIIDQSNIKKESINKLFLIPNQPANDEVIIQGKRRNEVSKKRISIAEAKEIAPGGDPAQVTKLLPGVQVQGFRPQVIIRGSEPQDSGYFVDGIEVPFVYHTIGGFSVLPEKLISSVDFSAGGFGSQFGDITGGIIGLNTKTTLPENSISEFKINLPLYSGAFHERKISDSEAISASFRKSYLDYIVPYVLKDDLTVTPSFWDSHLRYLKRHKKGYTKILAISSLDELKLVAPFGSGGDETGNSSFNINQYYGAIGIEHKEKISKQLSYKAWPNIVFSRITFDIIQSYVKIRGYTYRLPALLEYRIRGSRKAFIGVDLEYLLFDINIKSPDVNSEEPFPDFEDANEKQRKTSYSESVNSLWASYDLAINKWLFTPGIRFSYSRRLKKNYLNPRLQFSYNVSKGFLLKGAVGTYSKAPSPQQTDITFGNPNLSFERSKHYILGLEKKLTEYWFFDTQLYYKDSDNVVRTDTEKRLNNDGFLRSYGLEIFIRRNLTGRAFGWISYTISKTEQKASKNSPWKPTQVDQTHVLNLAALYKFTGQWSLGVRVNYRTGDRFTPVSDVYFNANLNKYQPINSNNINSGRLPNYHQIDIYSTYDFLWDYWKLKLRTGVEYLSFKDKALGYEYNYDYSNKNYVKGIPVIPYIEISGVF